MADHEVITCPLCGQSLRIPATEPAKRVRCPRCGDRFRFVPGIGVVRPTRRRFLPDRSLPPFVRIALWSAALVAVGTLWLKANAESEVKAPASMESAHPVRGARGAPVSGDPDRYDSTIPWRLGQVSPEFGLSRSQVSRAIERAIETWESAAGRELFRYDRNMGFPIDLLYGERQVQWNAQREANREIDRRRRLLQDADRLSNEGQSELDRARTDLQKRKEVYEANVEAYNRLVQQVNAQGGASAPVATELEAQRADLDAERTRLDNAAREVERLTALTNSLIDRRNREARAINSAVEAYNAKFGSRSIQLGRCVLDGSLVIGITIYAFSDEDHLAIVLAHELGHALGIEHVEGDGALMSAIEEGSDAAMELRLTERDREALRRALARAAQP